MSKIRKVNDSKLRNAFCAVLTMALIVCSIPPVLAQVTEEMHEELLKQQVLDQIAVDKARFMEGVVGRWISLTDDGGAELRSALMRVSNERLADASRADSMAALNKILFETDDLGSPSIDLVFNKVTPCRIIDTRLTAAGPLVANVTRNFDSNAGSFSSQGGSSTNCGLPGSDTAALMVILVAVDAHGVGNLRAFPKDASVPNAVVINYNSSNNLANSVMIPLKQSTGDGLEFGLRANVSNTDVVADVVGYFWAPSATPLNCTTVTASQTVANHSIWNFSTAACPAGRTLTGGGVKYSVNVVGTNVWFWQSTPNSSNDAWQTSGLNNANFSQTITAYARCCTIPGL